MPRYHGMQGDVVSYSCVVSAMARMAQWQQALAVLTDLGNDADEVAWEGDEGDGKNDSFDSTGLVCFLLDDESR